MDIEKLIEQLKYYGTTYAIGDSLGREIEGSDELMLNAATALSTLQAENKELRAEQKRVKRERDAAVGDMEALMWHSGEGCQICANAVEVHKRPYVRLDCKLGSGIDCKPKWRGQKED